MYANNNYDGKYLNEILNKGVYINTVNRRGETSLICSSSCENVSAIRLLLERGADPNIYDKDNESALGYAVLFGNPEITSMLIEAGADLEVENDEGRTILHNALLGAKSEEKSIEVIQLLIDANINTKKKYRGQSPLEMAIEIKKQEIIKLLKKANT